MTPSSIGPAPRRGSGIIVASLALGSLAFSILQSLVAPALATIGADLHADNTAVSWVLTAYLLAAAVFTPILGRLAEIAGKRRIMIAVLVILLAGTVLAALAPSLGVLIAARAIQGAAGAILPLSIALARDVVPPERIGATIGLLSAVFGVGGGIGILVAGPIVESLGWPSLFWLPAILIAVALAGAIIALPRDDAPAGGRLDPAGTVLLSVGLVALLLATTDGSTWGWGSPLTIGLLVVGAAAFVVFVFVELCVAQPLVDMRVIANRGVWTAHVAALLLGFGMFGLFVLIPALLQAPAETGFGFGATATQAGLALVPSVIAMVLASIGAGALARRLGTRTTMLSGLALVAVAFVMAALWHASIVALVVSVAIAGAGIGIGLSAISNAVVEAVLPAQTAEALSANTIARTIGGSIGTTIIAVVLSSSAGPGSGFTAAFWVCAVVSTVAIVTTSMAPGRETRTS